MSINVSLSSSSYTRMIKMDENVVASSAIVRSLLASTKNKTVVQNNNFTLAFKRRMMMIIFENLREAHLQH
jgi:hypothetical protein